MWKVTKEVKESTIDLSEPRPGTCSDQESNEKSLAGGEYANCHLQSANSSPHHCDKKQFFLASNRQTYNLVCMPLEL